MGSSTASTVSGNGFVSSEPSLQRSRVPLASSGDSFNNIHHKIHPKKNHTNANGNNGGTGVYFAKTDGSKTSNGEKPKLTNGTASSTGVEYSPYYPPPPLAYYYSPTPHSTAATTTTAGGFYNYNDYSQQQQYQPTSGGTLPSSYNHQIVQPMGAPLVVDPLADLYARIQNIEMHVWQQTGIVRF